MKTVRVIALLAFVALAVLGVSAADKVPPAYLPGLLQADTLPNGCVSCHVKVAADKDYTVVAELKKVKGHPDISKVVKSVPDGCIMCHKAGAKIATLGAVVHQVHFGPDTAKNVFVSTYGGSCLNCHKLDLKSGEMSFKKGPANW